MPLDEGPHQVPLAWLAVVDEFIFIQYPQPAVAVLKPYKRLVVYAAYQPWRITWHRTKKED